MGLAFLFLGILQQQDSLHLAWSGGGVVVGCLAMQVPGLCGLNVVRYP